MLQKYFSFFGSKYKTTQKGVYPYPIYDRIVEPFAGSAGYSSIFPHKEIHLCEIDPRIFGVWHYILHVSEKEFRALPLLESGQTVDDLNCVQEAKWLIGFWVTRMCAQPRKSPSAWMREGNRPNSFWSHSTRTRLAKQLCLTRHWQIYHCEYHECPVQGDATWFVDPPYIDMGKYYSFGSRRLDYPELGGWCKGREGQVIVCESEGADWLPFVPVVEPELVDRDTKKERVWLGFTR